MTKVPTDFFYDIADKLFSLVSKDNNQEIHIPGQEMSSTRCKHSYFFFKHSEIIKIYFY